MGDIISPLFFPPDFYDTCEDSNLVECDFDHTSLVESEWYLDSEGPSQCSLDEIGVCTNQITNSEN